ncbi:MAG: hypothetical protein U0Q22_15555 [Acidimicrobiales bacterium]
MSEETSVALEQQLSAWGVPSAASLVFVAGDPDPVSLLAEYDPPEARRQQFRDDLERLANAEREEIISSSEILL